MIHIAPKRRLALSLVAALLTLSAPDAAAQDCLEWPSAWDHSQAFDRVLQVRPLACDPVGEVGFETRFLVLHMLVGPPERGAEIRVKTGAALPCGSLWSPDEPTVLLANLDDEGGFEADACSAPRFPIDAYLRANIQIAPPPPRSESGDGPPPFARQTGSDRRQ